VTYGPGSTGGAKPGSNAEDDRGGEGDEWEQDGRPGQEGRRGTRHQGSKGRVDGVHEPEPAANEVTGQIVPGQAGDKSYK
jgi:hypothetical protein